MISPVEHFPAELYQDMSWCGKCGGPRIFVEIFEFESGRVGYCLGCGEERIAVFTRTTSEVP